MTKPLEVVDGYERVARHFVGLTNVWVGFEDEADLLTDLTQALDATAFS
ncbi:hypothetical protein J8I87_23455 [Paraburkholderia sp. LEh10]|nr:hypothetical protein [Paraburkholderia sp. LEh10]MBP0592639.1 hypothetical protein [Paraburkholderia sp. LEh10]